MLHLTVNCSDSKRRTGRCFHTQVGSCFGKDLENKILSGKKTYLINPTVKAATTGWVLGIAGENITQLTGNPIFLQF